MNDPTTEWAPFDKTRATPSGPRSRKEKSRVAPLSALARYLRHSGVNSWSIALPSVLQIGLILPLAIVRMPHPLSLF
jgi:hypothetical protein